MAMAPLRTCGGSWSRSPSRQPRPASPSRKSRDGFRRRRERNIGLASAGATLIVAAAVALPVALTSGDRPDLRPAGTSTGQAANSLRGEISGPHTQTAPAAGWFQLLCSP